MASAQIPGGLGILVLVVGLPIILYDAAGTNAELEQLNSEEAREARCMQTAAEHSLPDADREALCSCIVAEADARGLNRNQGGYDETGLNEVLQICYQVTVVQ